VIRVILSPVIFLRSLIIRKKFMLKADALNNLSNLIQTTPVIRVPDFNGSFAMDPRSDVFARIVIEKNYENEILQLCRQFINPAKDIVDIGANIGLYTVFFAGLLKSGRVFSVEPAQNALKYLYRNIELNKIKEKVVVFEGVISDQSGMAEIKTVEGKEEYSTIVSLKHPSVKGKNYSIQEVASKTLDELIENGSVNPGFIKVDVEGAEFLVFRSAQRMLDRFRPVIVSELSDYLLRTNGSSSKEVINIIRQSGYDIFDPVDIFARPGSKKFGDIICFPREMGVDLRRK
jgi:FkbM family methyltransferase